MKSLNFSLTVAVGAILLGVAAPVHAQMGPYNPPISPYINILRGGASPAINWFNIVQPQLEFNSALGSLQAQQSGLSQAVAAGSLGTTTGHPVMFGNYSHYYGRSMGTGGSSMGGMGMGGMGMGGMGMGGMGGMNMGGMGMGGMNMGGMGMGGMGMGGMNMGGMNMGGMGR